MTGVILDRSYPPIRPTRLRKPKFNNLRSLQAYLNSELEEFWCGESDELSYLHELQVRVQVRAAYFYCRDEDYRLHRRLIYSQKNGTLMILREVVQLMRIEIELMPNNSKILHSTQYFAKKYGISPETVRSWEKFFLTKEEQKVRGVIK